MDRDDPKIPPLPLVMNGSAWAIRPETLAHIARVERLIEGSSIPVPHVVRPARARVARRGGGQRAGGSVAVIPLCGVLTARGSWLSMIFGGNYDGLQGFREEFRAAVASPDVGAIVLDVDSPGGKIELVPETAQEIFDARGTKPIIAVANTNMCSGAYWIGSQADEIVITPSGQAGSIGSYVVHHDYSSMNDQIGVQPTYISAGKYKTEGNADQPLSDDAKADWQQWMDDIYTQFTEAVARGRGTTASVISSNYGQGRVMVADRALQAGVVDRIDTIEGVIGSLLSPGSTGIAAAKAGRAALVTAADTQRPGDQDEEPDDEDVPAVPDGDPAPAPGPADDDPAEPDDDDEDDAVLSAADRSSIANALLL